MSTFSFANAKKASELAGGTVFTMLVYGEPGVGKTTFGASGAKPFILDLEKSAQYLANRGIEADVDQGATDWNYIKGFAEAALAASKEGNLPYKTLVIDSVTVLQDILMRHANAVAGSNGFKKWDLITEEFAWFVDTMREAQVFTVFIGHLKEKKIGDKTVMRIDLMNQMLESIHQKVEVYMLLEANAVTSEDGVTIERVAYTAPVYSDTYNMKDRTGLLPQVIKSPNLLEIQKYYVNKTKEVRSAKTVKSTQES